MRKMIIDDAPRKDLISIIVNSGDTEAFRDYFVSRIEWAWCKNPIIHDHLVSYSIFHDLLDNYLTPTVSKSLYEYVLSDLEAQNSDAHFICSIFILNSLKDRWQLNSLGEVQVLLDRLMKYENKIISLKQVNGNITYWFYEISAFYQYEKISLTKYDDIAESAVYPSEMKDKISKSYVRALKYEKAVSYRGCNYWIWRGVPTDKDPSCGPNYLRAIVGKKDGSFTCYGYCTSPEFSVPPEAIVARIDDADFQIGDLDEIS